MQLHEWAQQPEAFRDEEWEQNFLNALVQGQVEIVSDEPMSGPDGWPYMLVKTSAEAEEPSRNLLHWLSENGVGLVINSHKEMPDYVFTYGMIWNFRHNGHFLSSKDALPDKTGEIVFKQGQQVHAGDANEAYLPKYARDILKQFFKQQNVDSPKILVMSSDGKNYDLVISLDAIGNPPKEEHQGILEAISWFLPLGYSLILASEEGLPPFFDL
ncbi:MAG: hypothetical protein CL677_04150 [Bdellovibrionaceae bacterium]|nr:hypothetical protein [Pseudobdellovibrionaceae bacterium]|tara:strand:+ start:37399 stop:38040 length:642 start_codon:yes stop_codon:yes gene_type:complete